MHTTLKSILKKEGVAAKTVAKWCDISETSFRRMLRGEIKMDVDDFNNALDKLGYKIIIAKKEHIV